MVEAVRMLTSQTVTVDRLIFKENGICAIIVNDKILRKDGRDTLLREGNLPGEYLRNGRAKL